jgi:hypothetical protein
MKPFIDRCKAYLTYFLAQVFIFHCSIPFPEAPVFELLLFTERLTSSQSGSNVSSDGDNTNGAVPIQIDSKKYIFVTQANFDGNLAGIAGADSKCATEKNTNFSGLAGVGSDYKALLVTGTTRRACSTANCGGGLGENIDWVIKTNTEYFRSDGLSLFTSNAAGIFVFGNMNNPFSLNTSDRWWTGLDDNWVTDSFDDCSGWISIVSDGKVGFGNQNTYSALGGGLQSEACGQSKKLLCVRQ